METAEVNDSVLLSVKKKLGLAPDYGAFDTEIISFINTGFSLLHQMGVGPHKVFTIDDASATWGEFTKDKTLSMAQTWMYLKVRLLFDPPSVATMFQAMNDQIDEYEWRLYVAADEARGGDDDATRSRKRH